MQAYPEPDDSARGFHAKRAMFLATPHRPIASDLLEMKRWMTRIFPEQFEVLVGQSPDLR
jgi:hypothetical protein